MKLSNTTLTMMRGSAGAVMAAAALSGVAQAGSANGIQNTSANDPFLTTMSERGVPNAEPPKKDVEQPPKKGHECGPCGMG